MMVLDDPEMIGQIKETIRTKKNQCRGWLEEVTDMFIAIFEGMEDNLTCKNVQQTFVTLPNVSLPTLVGRNCQTLLLSMKKQSGGA